MSLLSKSEGLKFTAGSLLRHALPGYSRSVIAAEAVPEVAEEVAPKSTAKRATKKTAKKKARAK